MSNRDHARRLRPLGIASWMVCGSMLVGCNQGEGDSHEVQVVTQVVAHSEMSNLGVDGSLFSPDTPIRAISGNLPALQSVAAIAVARIRCDGNASDRPLQVEPLAPERGAFWNQILGDLSNVREVAVLGTLGLDPRGVSLKEILQAARGQECNYCLLFQIDDFQPTSAHVRAVLWNVDDGAALVAFNTSVQLSQVVIEKCSDDEDLLHRRMADASYQVEAELRRMVHDTFWDMAARTAPGDGPASRPNPWKTDQPILPRDDYRYRRYFLRGGE